MKFKIGDKVRLKDSATNFARSKLHSCRIYTVKEVYTQSFSIRECNKPVSFHHRSFELVEREVQSEDYGPLKIKFEEDASSSNSTSLTYVCEDTYNSHPDLNEAMLSRDWKEGASFSVPVYFYPSVEEELNGILKRPGEWNLNEPKPNFLDITERSARFGGCNYYRGDSPIENFYVPIKNTE